MGKDFANSWEQKSWQFAAERHQRFQRLAASSHEGLSEYAKKVIKELEEKYPQLAVEEKKCKT